MTQPAPLTPKKPRKPKVPMTWKQRAKGIALLSGVTGGLTGLGVAMAGAPLKDVAKAAGIGAVAAPVVGGGIAGVRHGYRFLKKRSKLVRGFDKRWAARIKEKNRIDTRDRPFLKQIGEEERIMNKDSLRHNLVATALGIPIGGGIGGLIGGKKGMAYGLLAGGVIGDRAADLGPLIANTPEAAASAERFRSHYNLPEKRVTSLNYVFGHSTASMLRRHRKRMKIREAAAYVG